MNNKNTENILNFPITSIKKKKCVDNICKRIECGEYGLWLACMNPHSYAESLYQKNFAEALRSASFLIPDGFGIVLASRILGGSIQDRITGDDIFKGVMSRLNRNFTYSVFFLGSTVETLNKMCKRLCKDYPNVRVAGIYSPPFKNSFSKHDIDEMVESINSAKPDVLWVGMTAPKQEIWIYNNIKMLPTVRFAGAIGAVFDFYAGHVKRAHPAFLCMGLEWLPRLMQQPRRLWRRMLISAPIFLLHLLRTRLEIILNKFTNKFKHL